MTKNRSVLSYFYIPILLTIVGLTYAYATWGVKVAVTITVLTILEISLSFDNAVVNATILRHWNDFWRKIFLSVGIIIAVFGMRAVFPILIVSTTTGMGWGDVITTALNDPAEYGRRLTAVHHMVAAFGGAFLAMVGLSFFMDEAKEHHWLGWLEKPLSKAVGLEDLLTLTSVLLVSRLLPDAEHQLGFVFAGLAGYLIFRAVKTAGDLLGGGNGDKVVRQGIWGFLYIELIDASFSFDGVIGAFALTNYLPHIVLGLGLGALYVREATILMLDKGVLEKFKYMEHGAFWAILALWGIMFASGVGIHVPEYVTGLLSAGLILTAVVHSAIVGPEKTA